MPLEKFVNLVLLNRCLREGPFQGPRKYGVDTSLWKSLTLLSPEKNADGTWKWDATFFLTTPVHEPLVLLQKTLQQLSKQYNITPNSGENLTQSFIPRINQAVTEQKKHKLNSDNIELTAQNSILIDPLDADSLKSLMMRTFDIESMDESYRNNVLARAGLLVFEKFITEAYDLLSDEEQDKLEDLVSESSDPNEVMSFLEHRLPNFDHMLATAVVKVRSEYKDNEKLISDVDMPDFEDILGK